MSDRATQLLKTLERQIAELTALLAYADEKALRKTCSGREKLGDGTVAAVALHTTDTYLRIAAFIQGHDMRAHTSPAHHEDDRQGQHVDVPRLVKRLTAGRHALDPLAHLTDEQLDAAPPAGQARFCDGQRTTEQVLAAMLKHQGHQIDALRASIA